MSVISELELRLVQVERQHYVLKGREQALLEMIEQQGKRFQSITEKSPLPGQYITVNTVDNLAAVEWMINLKMQELQLHSQPENSSGSSGGSGPNTSGSEGAEYSTAAPIVTYVDQILTNLQTPEQLQRFKAITSDEYRRIYNRFAEMASILIKDTNFNPETNNALLERLLDDMLVVMLGVQLVQPDTAWDASGRNVATGAPVVVPESLWPKAIKQLGLSSSQKQKIAGAYIHFAEAQAATAAERQQLLLQLGQHTERSSSFVRQDVSADEHERLLQQVEKCMKKVKESGVVVINMCLNTMTKRQIATFVAVCYPYWADGVAMAKVVYEELAAQGLAGLSRSNPLRAPVRQT